MNLGNKVDKPTGEKVRGRYGERCLGTLRERVLIDIWRGEMTFNLTNKDYDGGMVNAKEWGNTSYKIKEEMQGRIKGSIYFSFFLSFTPNDEGNCVEVKVLTGGE